MQLSRPRVIPAILIAALLVLAGCDLFGSEDTVIRASGTVVLAETGEPLDGLSVALNSDAGGFGGRRVETTVQTDSEGAFVLSYDTGGSRFGYDVRINANPYNPDYTGRLFTVQPGESRDIGVIELEEIED